MLGLLIFPFFLVFFTLIVTPYILMSKARSVCVKIVMLFLGLILGAVLTPFFIAFVTLYLLALLAMLMYDCCSSYMCECMSYNG